MKIREDVEHMEWKKILSTLSVTVQKEEGEEVGDTEDVQH